MLTVCMSWQLCEYSYELRKCAMTHKKVHGLCSKYNTIHEALDKLIEDSLLTY